MKVFTRRTAIGGLLSSAPLLSAGAAWAQAPVVGGAAQVEAVDSDERILALDAWTDTYGRPTTSVHINGHGPYAFLVDTGSTATVLSERVALAAGAGIDGTFMIAGATGTAVRPYADIQML